jgi:histidine triad (HIT) family protein
MMHEASRPLLPFVNETATGGGGGRRSLEEDPCIFCKIIQKKCQAQVLYEDDLCLSFSDIRPQAPHHLLLIPKKHISTLNELEHEDGELITRLMFKVKDIARALGFIDQGYRMVVNVNEDGGQEVRHLHFHLLAGRKMNWPPG